MADPDSWGVRWRKRGFWFVPAAAVIALMRLRFLFTPVTSDEGAFLGVAKAWRSGAVLYRDIWADRPQGQFVLYRIIDMMGLGNPVGIRLLGLVACLVGAAACGRIAARLAGDQAAWITALVVGILASVPRYEAFVANGELLSCSIGAVSLALMLRAVWDRPRPSLGALLLAGIAGGCALSVKQTGFDAFVVGCVVLAVSLHRAGWSSHDRRLAVPALITGLLLPIGLMILHAALTGWHRWWFALVTYRSTNRSVLTNSDWKKFLLTGRTVAPVLFPAILLVLVVLFRRAYRGHRRVTAVFVVWSVAALLAFVSGGQFFRHYWMILVFPLGTMVGTILSFVEREQLRRVLLAAVLVSPLAFTAQALTVARSDAGMRFSEDQWAKSAEHVADWFDSHAGPADRIYALCAAGSLYGNLSVPPPFPYLWLADIRDVPGARARLAGMLQGPGRPRYVAQFQVASECDPSGGAQAALDRNYGKVATIDRVTVFERRATP